MKAGSTDSNNLEHLANEADDAMAESEGRPQAADAGVQAGENDQGGAKADITGEAEITQEDARDMAEFVVMGSAGLVEEVWPVIAYPKETTAKGIDRLQPLMYKYAARMFPLAGQKISLLRIYKEYKDEAKAIYYFSNLIVQTVRAVRADKLKGEEVTDDGQGAE